MQQKEYPPILDDSLWVGEETVILLEVNGKRQTCLEFLSIPN